MGNIDITKAFVQVEKGVNFNGSEITSLEENKKKIFFDENTNTIWHNGKSYGGLYTADEDLIIENNTIKLNNKKSSQTDYISIGKVYLRKNIVNNKNILEQNMFHKESETNPNGVPNINTIFIIQYDYDLNLNPISIPDNSILRFEGGSIKNGSILLNNTLIEGDPIFENVNISGSCRNSILTPQLFGAKGEVSEHNNIERDTLGFQNLALVANNENTLSSNIYIPKGHYSINKRIVFYKSCTFYGDGENTVLDFYDGEGGICFGQDKGTWDNNYNCKYIPGLTITKDVKRQDRSIEVNDSSKLSVGQYIIITDVVDGTFNPSRVYYRQSEILKINKIEENVVTFESAIQGQYFYEFKEGDETSINEFKNKNVRTVISEFNPTQLNISNFKIYSHPTNKTVKTYYSFAVVGFINSKFENIKIENYGNKVPAYITVGYNYTIEKCTFRNYQTGYSDSYGLALCHSQHFTVTHCAFKAEWHSIATGGGSGIFAINNRDFLYDRLIFEGYEEGKFKIDLDVHANAENYKFMNIDAPHVMCDTGGYHITIENCRLGDISSSFHCAGMIIRNCELMNTINFSDLYWFKGQPIDYDDYDMIVEGNKIHGRFGMDLQDANGYIKNLIFRNNICDGLLVSKGYIKNIYVDNNILNSGNIDVHYRMYFDNIQVNNNTLLNGFIMLLPENDNNAIGNISNNIVAFSNSNSNNPTIYLKNIYGKFTNNNVIGNIEGDLFIITLNSNLIISDNILKHGEVFSNSSLGSVRNNSKVIFKNNIHNCTRFSPFYRDSTSAIAISDKYNYMNITELENNTIKDSIGNQLYFRNNNKFGYVSSTRKGNLLNEYNVSSSNPILIQNNLSKNKLYFVEYSSNNKNKIYFSKTEEINENELLLVSFENDDAKNTVFSAPDSSIYPYMYITTNGNNISFKFYENRNASEYDGAKLGVNRFGNSNNRPIGTDIYIGFMYMDSTLGKPIYAKTITDNNVIWVDSIGTIV